VKLTQYLTDPSTTAPFAMLDHVDPLLASLRDDFRNRIASLPIPACSLIAGNVPSQDAIDDAGWASL
jgi:hypothetical protein